MPQISDINPNEFCTECGERLAWFAADMAARCPNVSCKTNTVDWEQPMEPGPVRLRTREEIMEDGRRARWHADADMPIPQDRDVVIGMYSNDVWYMKRKTPKENEVMWCDNRGQRATHWAEDILGTP